MSFIKKMSGMGAAALAWASSCLVRLTLGYE